MLKLLVAKFCLSCSLWLLFGLSWGQSVTPSQLESQLDGLNVKSAEKVVLDYSDNLNSNVSDHLPYEAEMNRFLDDPDESSLAEFKITLHRVAALEPKAGVKTDGQNTAEEIAKDPKYQSRQRTGNWLTNAITSIKKLFQRKPEPKSDSLNLPSVGAGAFAWLGTVVWVILIGGALAAIVLVLRFVRFRSSKRAGKKKSGGLLSEDEPDRTADEWIMNADALIAQGKYREACRSLYLACLLQLDENRIMRFIRSETNWEHYYRYMDTPNRPPQFDLLSPTQQLDQIWYGGHTKGLPDAQYYKEVYNQLCQILAQMPNK